MTSLVLFYSDRRAGELLGALPSFLKKIAFISYHLPLKSLVVCQTITDFSK